MGEGKLKVLSHSNKGLRVEGLESDKRIFLMKLSGTQAGDSRQDILKYVVQYCHITTTEYEVQFLSEMLARARYLKHRTSRGMIERLTSLVEETIPEAAPVLMKKIRKAVREYFHQPA